MHPPLDRAHPDCQESILALRHCHATQSKLKFWACNEIKFKLDACFKEEKDRMLKEVNKGFEKRRFEEDEQSALSTGRNMSFQNFLDTDKTYRKELGEIKDKKGFASWFA
jgi:COX assembly protein 2